VVYYQPIVPPDALITNDIRYEYYNVITKPDNTTERIPASGTTLSDSTGTNYFPYTPDQVGTYTVKTVFVEQMYRWYSSSTQRNFYGITLKESSYTSTVVVQEELVVPKGFVTTPLPTEYWTRPIEGQNTDWYKVASNWLSNSHDQDNGGPNNRYQQDGIAPNSAHILWTQPTEDGGLVGGGNFSVPGDTFNAGHQYQPRFQDQIIMYGRLYYSPNLYWSGSSSLFDAVDLRTGELLWEKDGGQTVTTLDIPGFGTFTTTTTAVPAFGYYYDFDSPNQHGITTPGFLFTNNFGVAYHPARGDRVDLNVTNVPSGFEAMGPKGEILRYVLTNVGTSSNPQYYLAQWNSSKVLTDEVMSAIVSGTLIANVPLSPPPAAPNNNWNGSMWVNSTVRQSQGYPSITRPSYDWNVSIDASAVGSVRWGAPGQTTPTIRAVIQNDIVFGSNGTVPQGTGSPSFAYADNSTWWAISLKPENRGKLNYMETIDTLDETDNDMLSYQRAAEGVFVFVEMPTLRWVAYDMHTGKYKWETKPLADFNPFGYFSFPSLMFDEASTIAYGKLFVGGYVGGVFAYDLNNGTQLWNYTAPTDMSVFKYYTLMLGGVADNKLFVGTHEHSADTPLFKGNRIRVLDVNTGEEVWSMLGWAHPRTMAIADGILIYWNNYDHQIYAVGKGPTSTTVEAPMAGVTLGSSLVIRGKVIDVSAGTKQKEQIARFPNGVAAVSDESQGDWMEYVYMQKAFPADCTGVNVTISVLDENGNYRDIGTATSDASGSFSLKWTPDIPGKFNVVARFAGSESYYGSYAETAFVVDEAPQATPPPTPSPAPATDMYVTGFGIGIIIAIVAVGIVIIIFLRRK
jgi:outer membrane protein assembly factor BamB